VFWVHSERASPQVLRHTICQGRLICVGNSGTAAVVLDADTVWFVEASKLVASLADAQYCLRVLEVPAPVPVEPELCCIMPEPTQAVPEMQAGAWCRPISGCEHDRKKTTSEGWECRDCGLVEVYS
jgi:hypothetical protein